jgi:hypothetical protein
VELPDEDETDDEFDKMIDEFQERFGKATEEGRRAEEARRFHEKVRRLVRKRRLEGQALHQQFTIAIGTLGGIAFAGLVLILQDQGPFTVRFGHILTAAQSFDALVVLLACVSILAMTSVLASSFVGADLVPFTSAIGWYGYGSGLTSIVGFVLAIDVIVNDVSPVGDTILTVLIVVIGVIMAVAFYLSLRERMAASRDETQLPGSLASRAVR